MIETNFKRESGKSVLAGVITHFSLVQGGTATPGATKQLLPPDRVLKELYIYIYIYTPDQLKAETTLDVHLDF